MTFKRPLKTVCIEQSLEKCTILSTENIMQVLHGQGTHEPEYIHLLKLQNKTKISFNPKQKVSDMSKSLVISSETISKVTVPKECIYKQMQNENTLSSKDYSAFSNQCIPMQFHNNTNICIYNEQQDLHILPHKKTGEGITQTDRENKRTKGRQKW